MVALIVILTIVVFVLVDLAIRSIIKRAQEAHIRRERAAALDKGVKLTFATEARSLKRVEVDNPKARILAVDDEAVILDSFRKILVLAGYSIDTVESGPEALTLVRSHNYDFVFTDLKMPEMDGVQVTKGVKHLRPDIDVIIITGYASIESAVETMKDGAMDYLQKPFTEDELVAVVDKFVIRRQDRIEKTVKPTMHLVTASEQESPAPRTFNLPAGVFVAAGHTWIAIEPTGIVRVGLDDFAQKLLGNIDRVDLPPVERKIIKGETLFTLHSGSKQAAVKAPVSGRMVAYNGELQQNPGLINHHPFGEGWTCRLDADNIAEDVKALRIGNQALLWYQDEIDRYNKVTIQQTDGSNADAESRWMSFSSNFLQRP